jgi:hypothetical protein
VKVYGEFAPALRKIDNATRGQLLDEWNKGGKDFSNRWKVSSQIPSLQQVLVPDYPSFTNLIPDVVRAQIFLKHLKTWEQQGTMPNLIMMQLNCDHTMGTTPGISTPEAMIADNDYAVGQVVESLSHSSFWKNMLIVIVEDDAQFGVDHVDGHRTVALLASPYIRRHSVDSTIYSHTSVSKTIEQILGLAPLSLFDLIATDLRASFQDVADMTPYKAELPKQSLFAITPLVTSLSGSVKKDALASASMNWRVPDAVPTGKLNRILWRAAKGPSVFYPVTRQGVFAPLSNDIDDADRDDK